MMEALASAGVSPEALVENEVMLGHNGHQTVAQTAVQRHGTFFQDAFDAAADDQIRPVVHHGTGHSFQL